MKEGAILACSHPSLIDVVCLLSVVPEQNRSGTAVIRPYDRYGKKQRTPAGRSFPLKYLEEPDGGAVPCPAVRLFCKYDTNRPLCTEIVVHLGHRGGHHRRTAEIVFDILGRFVILQVVVENHLMDETDVALPVVFLLGFR